MGLGKRDSDTVGRDSWQAELALVKKLSSAVGPREIASRVSNNRDVFRDFLTLATAAEDSQREEAFERIRNWSVDKIRARERQKGSDAAKGLAHTLLGVPWIEDSLRRTRHLGVLAPMVQSLFRREDYVKRQLHLIFALKQSHAGLGLGARGDRDAPALDGTQITGLELLQSWAILQSASHLFGTFATERAVLFLLKRSPALQRSILEEITPRLRTGVEPIIRDGRVYSFVNVLTAWRISTEPLEENLREAAIDVHYAYLTARTNPRLARLRELYRRIRQLAYVSLQTDDEVVDGLSGLDSAVAAESVIRRLLRKDTIAFEAFEPSYTSLAAMLDAIDTYHYDTFFTSEEASRLVLDHMREFSLWWESRRACGELNRLRTLFSRPGDWPKVDGTTAGMQFYLRLDIPFSERDCVNEVEAWWNRGEPWKPDSNFFLAFPPKAQVATVNVYVGSTPRPELLHHIASNLAKRARIASERHRAPGARELWRSCAQFGCRLLELLGPRASRVLLRPQEANDGRVGLAVLADLDADVLDRLVQIERSLINAQRRAELATLHRFIEGRASSNDEVTLVFVGQLLLIEEETDKELAEIDGVIARIGAHRIEWTFLEFKDGKQGATRQLKYLVSRFPGAVISAPTAQRIGTTRVGVATASWPALAPPSLE